jgi:uncharacterized membrane protein (UPF0127 family)
MLFRFLAPSSVWSNLVRSSLVLALAVWIALFPWTANADHRLEAVTIETASGPVIIDSEVMRSEVERERGLMMRPYLPDHRGMLFDFGEDRVVEMWMKDTLIPLDMIFFRKDGTIARITVNAEPFSTRILSSGEPVRAVLEINGGYAARFGIKTGDVAHHALFGNAP